MMAAYFLLFSIAVLPSCFSGSAQEFVKVCNWRRFQNAGLRRLEDRFAIVGRWCGGFIRGDGHRIETFQGFFPGEVTQKR